MEKINALKAKQPENSLDEKTNELQFHFPYQQSVLFHALCLTTV